jgi:hypothetical protein
VPSCACSKNWRAWRRAPAPERSPGKREAGRRSAALLAACLLIAAGLAACALFGVPEFPPELAAPLRAPGRLFVVYDPWAVLGFGHTGLIVADPSGAGFHRFDQYASSEIDFETRAARGQTRFWEALTARLPPLAGYTRELVTRRSAFSAAALVDGGEYAVPVQVEPGALRAIHGAAEARFREAALLESPRARRYFLFTNNCQTFIQDLLRAGGLPEAEYFPKHLMETYLAQYRSRGADGGGGIDGGTAR